VTKGNVNKYILHELIHCVKEKSIDMIKSIVMIHLFMLSTIQESWLVPPPTLPTPSMDGNSDLEMAADKHAAGLMIGFH